MGIPAAGSTHDHAPAAARRRNHCKSPGPLRIARPGRLIGIVATVGLLFALSQSGRLQRLSRGGAWMGAAAALALAGIGIALVPQRALPPPAVQGAETWSEARVASYTQQGKPVFVY